MIMREEKVTKIILDWLEERGWKILCYDFPQSGTGVLLHPNGAARKTKNKGGIVPDIVAVKNQIGLFFENKDRFYLPDFEKLAEIQNEQNYSESLSQLCVGYSVEQMFYGIAFPYSIKGIEKSKIHQDKIDFLLTVEKNGLVTIVFDNIGEIFNQ